MTMEVIILQFIKARGVGVKTIERFCTYVRQHKIYREELKGRHAVLFLKEQLGVKVNLAETIVAKYDEARREWDRLVENNILTSKQEWDSYETSWDFEQHPLI